MANYLTAADVQNYGSELVDFAQRAAAHAVSPQIDALRQDNLKLRRRLATESRRNLDMAVERAVPNYREIDADPRWHSWLVQIDPLTGQMRQQLLNAAVAAGDANRVRAFFNGFVQQHGAASQTQTPSRTTRSSHSS